MTVRVDRTGMIDPLQMIVSELSAMEGIQGLLVLCCDENRFQSGIIEPVLRNSPIPIFGGIFPAIIHGREKMSIGTIVVGLEKKPEILILPDLSDENVNHEQVIEDFAEQANPDAKTIFVFIDGYSKRVSSFLESLYNVFGPRCNYIGAGAGSINPLALDTHNALCLFSKHGLVKDSALLVLIDIESSIGAGHGWKKISGPYRVTKSSGNAIHALDWKPALEVYKQAINQFIDTPITHENFFDISKNFPFGISHLDSEIVVRDLFTVDGESLIVATEIPQESFIDILTGDIDSLVHAAEESYNDAMKSFKGKGNRWILFIDCISRVLFLADNFFREIEAVNSDVFPLVGVLSLGEIASDGTDYMELYNKTCVVSVLANQ